MGMLIHRHLTDKKDAPETAPEVQAEEVVEQNQEPVKQAEKPVKREAKKPVTRRRVSK